MIITKDQIKSFIPQREPFIMVDELLTANDTGFTSRFTVQADNVLLEGESLSESALMENIAQTCAAGFGYLNSLREDGEPKLGFIGAITKVDVLGAARLNDRIETTIEVLNTFDSIHLVSGIARCNAQTLLTCQMKIVLG